MSSSNATETVSRTSSKAERDTNVVHLSFVFLAQHRQIPLIVSHVRVVTVTFTQTPVSRHPTVCTIPFERIHDSVVACRIRGKVRETYRAITRGSDGAFTDCFDRFEQREWKGMNRMSDPLECLQIGATSNDAFVIVYYNQVVGAENSSRRAADILTIYSAF